MPIEMVHIGFGNVVAASRVVSVVRAGSLPIKRLIDAAERQGRLIDCTSGRRTRSIVVTDSNHVILTHLQPNTLAQKLSGSAVVDFDGETEPSVPSE